MATAYEDLMERVRDIGRLQTSLALLDWDQETYMPPNGVKARAEQIALLSGIRHTQLIDPQVKRLLDEAQTDEHDHVARTNVRETRRNYERAAKLPTQLVKDLAHTSTLAKDAWAKARAQSDFSIFSPLLSRLLELTRQKAEHIGYSAEPYDALIDEFEPGATSAQIEGVFARLRDETVRFLKRLMDSSTKPDRSILTRHYPEQQQRALSRKFAEALNFDFESGRLDVTVHPFCATIGGGGDVRITTRYLEDFFQAAMFGTMHETGHALYEQGLPREHMFTPMGEAVSLGIHESQSLMWENQVGRSRAFWEHHFAEAARLFPKALGDVSLDAFYGAINTVEPSFIRVEADELTYNLHVILRFEIERELFNGQLEVDDIPKRWNVKMEDLLGITPPDDAQGCLQDIHWSMGAFGYFATYALGKLYAAQFFTKAKEDIPDLFDRIRANDHKPLLNWLRENIHRHGQRFRAGELVERVTGKPLTIEPFMSYVKNKFAPIYGL